MLTFDRSQTIQDYASNVPFPNTRLEGIFDADLLRNVGKEFKDHRGWMHYYNPLERKRTWNSGTLRCDSSGLLFDKLSARSFLNELSDLTGIQGLQADPELYGGGLSAMGNGDFLKLHRDLELHPKTGMERRLNLVIFLDEDWREEYGGHLELWSGGDAGPVQCMKRMRPTFGRVVLLDPAGFHGVPDPITCPPDVERRTVNVFMYTEPKSDRKNCRSVAQFAGRTRAESDQLLNEFRRHVRETPASVQ